MSIDNWLLIEEAEEAFILDGTKLARMVADGEIDFETRIIDGNEYFLVLEEQLERLFSRRVPKRQMKEVSLRVAEALGLSMTGALLYDEIKSKVGKARQGSTSQESGHSENDPQQQMIVSAKEWVHFNVVERILSVGLRSLADASIAAFTAPHSVPALISHFKLIPSVALSCNVVMTPQVASKMIAAFQLGQYDPAELATELSNRFNGAQIRLPGSGELCACPAHWLDLFPGDPGRFSGFVWTAMTAHSREFR